jgi:hypothetical protein
MIIKIFNKYSDIPESDMLIGKTPIFATQNYADYLKELRNRDTVWFAQLKDNTVSFLIPLAVNKKLIFKRGYFLSGVISFNPDSSLEEEKEFLDNVVNYIKKEKLCDWIQQGPNWALFNTFPSGSKAVKFGTYKIFLKDKTEDELFNSIKRNHRNNISNAKKSEVKIKKGIEYLNDCQAIINETARKANLNLLTLTELKRLFSHFKADLKIYVSYLGDVPQSAAIFLGNGFCTYALYAGSINKAFRGSNAYLDWEAIKDSKNTNSDGFDFVGARINPAPGSKLEGIQNYKKRFGCDFVQGYLWKITISERKFKVFNFLLKIYFLILNKKNKKDIIDEEFEIQKNEDIHSDN